jgi:hypothetical protein
MVSEEIRLEVMNIVDRFNQNEFNRDDSYYFVRFSNDFVYIDRCEKGRIELFSRFKFNLSEDNLLVEIMNNSKNEFMVFNESQRFSESLEKPLQSVMQYGLQDI